MSTPQDLELPPKFDEWRPKQLDAVIDAACSDTRFTILNMPPGTGKSPAYMGISRIVGGRMLVLTQSKGLQTQLMNDFAAMGLMEVKGLNNYPCLLLSADSPSATCDEGPCHAGVDCSFKEFGCHYYDAVRAASKSPLVVTNYSYWMTVQRYADPLSIGTFSTLVLDEAHDAADALSEFVRINVERQEVSALLGMSMPRQAAIEEWAEWASHALPDARNKLELAKNAAIMHRHGATVIRRLHRLCNSLSALAHAKTWTTDWVIDSGKEAVRFQPVWASGYAEDFLFAGTPRVIFTSATVTARDAKYLGVDPKDLTFKTYPSPFPVANRPIFVVPTVSVRYGMTEGELRIWLNRIDQIIDIEKEYKGIIHAVSYKRAHWIHRHSRHRRIMLIHDPRSTRSIVDRFKRASPPCILISPAVSTGWDFPYEDTRWMIVAKMPFIDSRSAVVKARRRTDKGYLNYVAMVALIQTVGRGVRAVDDWCRTYIIDDNWKWLYRATRGNVPRWFTVAIKNVRPADLPTFVKSH
jgi:ATP-dependent DNA helicase DinG